MNFGRWSDFWSFWSSKGRNETWWWWGYQCKWLSIGRMMRRTRHVEELNWRRETALLQYRITITRSLCCSCHNVRPAPSAECSWIRALAISRVSNRWRIPRTGRCPRAFPANPFACSTEHSANVVKRGGIKQFDWLTETAASPEWSWQ